MARSVLRREERRGAPRYGVRVWRTAAKGLRLAGAAPGSSDVGPRATVRAGSVDRGRGGEREGGVDLRGGQGQRPFLVVSDAPGVAVGNGQQAFGLGIVFRGPSSVLQMATCPVPEVIAGLGPIDAFRR